MPKPRIKQNGVPGEWELEWSSAELAFGSIVLASIIGFGSWLSLVTIASGRESAQNGIKIDALIKQHEDDKRETKETFAERNRRISRLETEAIRRGWRVEQP